MSSDGAEIFRRFSRRDYVGLFACVLGDRKSFRCFVDMLRRLFE